MIRATRLSAAVAFVWAGVAIGGSLIATPAKFQAPSLSLTTALEVGRAQFFWIGVGEWVLCAAFVVTVFLSWSTGQRLMVAPVLIFLVQRLALMPVLDAHTLEVIAGRSAGVGNLHILYIGVEIAKVAALLVVGGLALNLADRPERNSTNDNPDRAGV